MKKVLILLLFASINSFAQTAGQWTWMQGSSTPNSVGSYGTQGMFSPTNEPQAMYEICEWTDKQGNFWMFGGSPGYPNFKSDLWEYKSNINEWAWIKGPGTVNQSGNYGTIDVPSASNNPGGRGFGVPSWVDTAGNLWVFGGEGYDVNGNLGSLNDLWKYNIATDEWTWMKGPNTISDPGNYGTIQVEASTNNPPSRLETDGSWTDADNNLWLFGGCEVGGGTLYSDLWKFDIATNNWVWMNGPNTANNPPVYGTKGVSASTNTPGGRWVYTKWKDGSGNFWIFGGSTFTNTCYSDLWRYEPTTNQWTWMSGPNTLNNIAVDSGQCNSSVNFYPAGRTENRVSWVSECNNLVTFGGINEHPSAYFFNDLWGYNINNNSWTFMSGTLDSNNAGNYGIYQVSAASNIPPNRGGGIGWKDNNGYLWMYGGSSNLGGLNDMWRFVLDPACPALGGTPVAAFTNQPDSGCAALTVNFTNTSVNGSSYLWNFGDNSTSQSLNVSHIYTDSGTYTVKLIAYPSCGGSPDTISHTVKVKPTAHASFTADTMTGCNILTVNFTNNSTNYTSFLYHYGDGNQGTNSSHTYGPGTYTVTLDAINTDGCNNDTSISFIHVISQAQVNPSFTMSPSTGCEPLTIHFTNTSNIGTSWLWEFGDNDTAHTQNAVHTYDTTGAFLVYLIVTDSSICGIESAQYTVWDTVYPSPVNGFTAAPMSGCTPDTVHFTNTTSGANSFLWNFGDSSPTTIASNPTHIYNTGGHDTVTLISYGNGGCNDTTHLILNITQAQTVTSSFTENPQSGCAPVTITFTNTSTNATGTLWRFGDNDTSTAISPTHTYNSPGTDTVKLYSINISACGYVIDSSTFIITVNAYANDSFTVSPDSGCTPLTVNFTNLSTHANSFLWEFGDTFTTNSTSPSHTYNTAGTDTVTLIGYGAGGCNDTIRYYPIHIIGAPTTVSAFTPTTNLSACDSLTVQFTNASTNAVSYLWKFGDGDSSTIINPLHTFTTSGTYTITLIAFDTTACGVAADTSIHQSQVTIYPSAHAAFPDSNFVGCNNLTISWGNLSTHAIGYKWFFGDGDSSTSGNPMHTYSTVGIYPVTLIAYGANGCNDTLTGQDTVTIINASILAAFTADSIEGCSPFTVQFTNNSVNGTAYLWSFGDGDTSTAANPSYTYLDSGTFTVKLYSYRNTNSPCGILEDSAILSTVITVDTPIHAKSKFTVAPVSGCSPVIATFIDSSKNYNFEYWNFGDGTIDSLFTFTTEVHAYYAGSYTATLITDYYNKCNTPPDTMRVDIIVDSCNLFIPNIFTPNGDGANELFNFEAAGFTNYHLEIFDRWGLKVFESSDANNQWNGNVNNTGGKCPDGTYYYIFSSIDYNSKPYQTHGYLTLIR